MIYFVIPLRSKAASRDWNTVTQNFNRTLESCYHQTSSQFKIFVAYHDMPKLEEEYDERVQFVKVNIPSPTNFEEMMLDKGYKMFTLMHAVYEDIKREDREGTYVFPVDADDLVSNKIASFFENKDDGFCYYSRYGYIWESPSKFLFKARDLWRTCGSCTVIYYKVNELPSTDFEHKDENVQFIFLNSHRNIPSYAKRYGKQFSKIPFPTTVYVLKTGENHSILSGHQISRKRLIEGIVNLPRPILGGVRKEFNIK